MSLAELLTASSDVWRRAPSAHNTQPWTIEAMGEQAWVGWKEARELPAGDPTRRDLWLGLGAFVEVVAICLRDAGVEPDITIEIDQQRRRFARLTTSVDRTGSPGSSKATSKAPLGPSDVAARRTHRGPMPAEVSEAVLASIGSLAGPGPGGPGSAGPGPAEVMRVDPGLVTSLLPTADRWLYDQPQVTAELRRWLRLSPSHPDYDRDGLSDRALDLRRWEAIGLSAALHPRVIGFLRATNATALLGRASRLAGLGTVVAMTGPTGLGPDGVADHGRWLVRWWLAATRHGLATHPLSQLLDCPATRNELHALARPGHQVLAIFRVGAPSVDPVRSARLTPAELLD